MTARASRGSDRRSAPGAFGPWCLAGLTLVGLLVAWPTPAETLRITVEDVEGRGARRDVPWLVRLGDEPAWAEPDFDDSDWAVGDPYLTSGRPGTSDWEGIGWFRLRFEVEDAVGDRPLALGVTLAGAAEIHLDGRLIGSFGRVAVEPNAGEEVFLREHLWLTLDPGEHLLAVRLSCHELPSLRDQGRFAGLALRLRDPVAVGLTTAAPPRAVLTEQVLFTSVAGALFLLQILLYLFDRQSKQSLYLAMVTAGFAVAAFLDFQKEFDAPLATSVRLYYLHRLFLPAWIIASLLFMYSLVYRRLPRHFRWVVVGMCGFLLVGLIYPPVLRKPLEVLGLLFFAELVRVAVVAIRRDPTRDSWILGLGMVALGLGSACDLVVDLGLIENFLPTNNPYLYGGLVLLVAMSVYLARSFSRTNRELENQLVRVRELSEKSLAQERAAREAEVERRVLEADHARKSAELEEARQLQLSLLPDELPEIAGWELAAAMRTATEVGGDYYDFRDDGELGTTLAVGDAAGHGARAGVLVAAAKSVFGALAGGPDLAGCLGEMNRAMRRMALRRLHMALLLARIRGGRVTVSSAGMPPALVFRAAAGEVEEIVVPGTPLGSASMAPYRSVELDLEPGDAVLFMSDGLPELVNAREEQVGYERSRELFREAASGRAEEILSALERAAEGWTAGEPPGDDVTLVVLKAR